MKNIRKVIYALIVLNLVVDAAFLVLAPDQVAVHFGASGEADRIGSKYEHLWFPALALAFALEPEQRRGVAQIAAFRRVRDDRLGRADRRSRARTAHEPGHARHGGHPLGGSRREHRRLVRVLPKALRLR